MSKKHPLKPVVEFIENVDDITNILFGRRLKHVIGAAAAAFGDDLRRKVVGETTEPVDPNDPYAVLSVRPTAPDKVVDWAYRALAHEYHPDSGKHPDGTKMKQINDAYHRIQEERRARSQAGQKISTGDH